MQFIIQVTTSRAQHEKLCDSMNDALRWLTRFDPSVIVEVTIKPKEQQ